MMKKMLMFLVVILVALVGVAFMLRPSDEALPHSPYFSGIEAELKSRGISRPAIFIDLDLVDQNLAAIGQHIQPPRHYRVVDKSLPSVPLIQYVMEKTGSHRVMSFHEPYLSMLIHELGPDVDFLLGKPMPLPSARDFFAGLPTDSRADAARRVQWLIDTRERMDEYLGLARELGLPLRVNLEIDVGLHRGGAKTNEEMGAMLELIAAHPHQLHFSGTMGYDGHLTHVPVLFGSKEAAVRKELEALAGRYRAFVAYGISRYPAFFTGDVTLNGAGSKTYQLYTAAHPLNDLAMGSAVVKPSAFEEFSLVSHAPAMFIAAPVLKRIDGFDVPFLDLVAPLAAWWNPNWRRTFYVYGGAWSEKVASPGGMVPNSLTTSPPNENLFPNQNMLNASMGSPIKVGDFIFYHPKQGDAMVQFETIYILRGGKIVGAWKPLAHRL